MLKFTPPVQVSKYAVYVPAEEPRPTGWFAPAIFRLHRNIGNAKQFFSTEYSYHRSRGGKILEFVDGEWYTLYEIAPNTEYKNLPWVKEKTNWYGHGMGLHHAVPMTREEYAEFRLAVERERVASQVKVNKPMNGASSYPAYDSNSYNDLVAK